MAHTFTITRNTPKQIASTELEIIGWEKKIDPSDNTLKILVTSIERQRVYDNPTTGEYTIHECKVVKFWPSALIDSCLKLESGDIQIVKSELAQVLSPLGINVV